jgi:hypothetical protein
MTQINRRMKRWFLHALPWSQSVGIRWEHDIDAPNIRSASRYPDDRRVVEISAVCAGGRLHSFTLSPKEARKFADAVLESVRNIEMLDNK